MRVVFQLRVERDAVMVQVLIALWVANRNVYGAHKLWKAARRAGDDIGRDQVARLMRQMATRDVSRRRKKVFTARQDPDAWQSSKTTSTLRSRRPASRLGMRTLSGRSGVPRSAAVWCVRC